MKATDHFEMILLRVKCGWDNSTGLIKVYFDGEFVKFDLVLENVPVSEEGNFGYELVAYWQSRDIHSTNFFTDSNSLELIERNFHQGKDGQDIPASYYPVTSMIGVRD